MSLSAKKKNLSFLKNGLHQSQRIEMDDRNMFAMNFSHVLIGMNHHTAMRVVRDVGRGEPTQADVPALTQTGSVALNKKLPSLGLTSHIFRMKK